MKKSIKIIAATFVVIGSFLTSCSTQGEKVVEAEENVETANQELDEEKLALQKEVEEYKQATADQIAANEKSLEEFNARIANQKSNAKASYEAEIAALNAKNSDLKKKIADFEVDNKSNWELFKSEFNDDMKDLGESFKNFTTKNGN